MAGFNNIELITDRPLVDNLKEIEEVKKYFPDHAVIASLMVETKEEWRQIIQDVENAGSDGIELNFGCPHGMCERGMGSAVGQEPDVLRTIVQWVMEYAKIPVIVKLTPNITDIRLPALAAVEAGADSISLINTIKSIVGLDLDSLAPYPVVDGRGTNGGYCGPAVKPIALNMLKDCAQHPDINIPISGIGGIETWRDAAEHILLGASSVQVCTAVMHYGFGIIRELIPGLERYMDEKGYANIEEMRGQALPNVVEWKTLNLKHKVIANIDDDKCIGCQLCYTACEDGAHQAIALPTAGGRVPTIIDENCVGCNLCSLVCPVEECITMEKVDDGTQHVTWEEKTVAGTVPTSFNDQRAGGVGHYVPAPTDALKKK
ncbi:UNVERIFIED_CONTAM: hypothetical protein GTU68_061027 [Idotea baltica]|nr:hypothetical protein [Idotea baltica]